MLSDAHDRDVAHAATSSRRCYVSQAICPGKGSKPKV